MELPLRTVLPHIYYEHLRMTRQTRVSLTVVPAKTKMLLRGLQLSLSCFNSMLL